MATTKMPRINFHADDSMSVESPRPSQSLARGTLVSTSLLGSFVDVVVNFWRESSPRARVSRVMVDVSDKHSEPSPSNCFFHCDEWWPSF